MDEHSVIEAADQVAFFEKKRDVFELIADQTMPGICRDEASAAEQVRALRQRLQVGNREGAVPRVGCR